VKKLPHYLVPKVFISDGKLVTITVLGELMVYCEQNAKTGKVLSSTQVKLS